MIIEYVKKGESKFLYCPDEFVGQEFAPEIASNAINKLIEAKIIEDKNCHLAPVIWRNDNEPSAIKVNERITVFYTLKNYEKRTN